MRVRTILRTHSSQADCLLGEGMFDGGDAGDGASTPAMKKKATATKGAKKPTNKKKSAKERLSMADGF